MKPYRQNPRARVFGLWSHGRLALPIWIFLLFACLPGLIATVSLEIVWLASPAVRADALLSSQQERGTGNDDEIRN